MAEETKLVFKPPGKDEPGFLRRSREAVRFSTLIRKDPSVEAIDSMVEFLSQYIIEPQDREEAKELLWDASENQFMDMLAAMKGDDEESDPIGETEDETK